MVNLGNAWHLPMNPEPRGLSGMRDPVFPTVPVDTVTIATGNQFQGGGNPGNQLQDGSALLYRQQGDPMWTHSPLVYAATTGNNKYYTAPIPMAAFAAGTILEYYLRIAYDDHDTTFLMANAALSTTTADEYAAQATPFNFTVDTAAMRGRWGKLLDFPNVPIHANVLRDGRVLMWGRRDSPDQSLDVDPPSPIHVGQPPADPALCTPFIWNPATGQVKPTDQLPLDPAGAATANIFCAGHAFLPDGRLLVAGGHLADGAGLAQTWTFDPGTDAWTLGAMMNHGRWYPTLTTMSDGSVLIVSGSYRSPGTNANNIVPQIWNAGSLTAIDSIPPAAWDLYPRLHVASDTRVFSTGSLQQTWVLDVPAGDTWTPGPLKTTNGQRDYGPSVLYDLDKVLYVGGGNLPTANADLLDLGAATPAWTATTPMAFARRQHNATVLADGTVLVTGGTRSGGNGPPQDFNNLDPGQPVHVAELWDPETQQWTSLAAEAVDRCYHATAILLPDATVLSAGGGEFFPIEGTTEENDPADTHRDGQIFTPPYLCTAATQPVITSAPDDITYGAPFHVASPQSATIAAVTWIRLSSVTHSFNTGQRFTKLPFVVAGNGLDVTAPASAQVCPPGHYMMFLIDNTGVPSIAKIMQIAPPAKLAPDEPAAPAALVAAETRARPRPPDLLEFRDTVLTAATGIKVVVGITGTCPYGIAACWGGANEALNRLDGVQAVDPLPDTDTSTATVFITSNHLSSLSYWRTQLRAIANQSYVLRGIELSLTGTLELHDGRLYLHSDAPTVRLGPLNPAEKVQWDRRTRAPQLASTAESTAYAALITHAVAEPPRV